MRLAAHGDCKQPLAFEAADLDGPARPSAICLDTQLKGDKLPKLTGSFRVGKFANSKMTLRVRRVRERETVFVHDQLDIGCVKMLLAKYLRRSANLLLKTLAGMAIEK
jgi:hypothetical protein